MGQRFLDFVPFDRDRGAGQIDARSVGQHRSAGVNRGELNEPRRHQVRRNDQRLGIPRNLDVVGHRHRDLDVGRPRLDRVDPPDRHTEDANLVPGVDANGGGEVRDDFPAALAPGEQHVEAADQRRNQRDDGDRPHTPTTETLLHHGDFGLMIQRS